MAILTNTVALTIAKALKNDYNVLWKHFHSSNDPRVKLQLHQEIQSYEIALLWIGSQTVTAK
jgi:hypothetical protein